MKNGKVLTLNQKKLIKSNGLDPENHLVVKNTPEFLEIVSRAALKKLNLNGKKPRTRKLYKD
ncbi:MAG: hypothetical protein HFG32_05510 [Eubacterium sp.]|mgnify:CR=1 FL=1|nr:hypothetical protein [Eubacterium sp.]